MTTEQTDRSDEESPDSPICLLAGADDAYAMPLAVALFSALDGLQPGTAVAVYIVDGGIGGAHRRRIEKVLARPAVDLHLHWVRPEASALEGLSSRGYISSAMYLRLLAPQVVSGPKVLYLDSDLVVRADLAALWATDVSGYALAAAQDGALPRVRDGILNWETQGLDPDLPYVNSGVLLLNLDWWRTWDAAEQILSNIRDNDAVYRYADQDGINASLGGSILKLDDTWNVQTLMLHDPHFHGSTEGACILHYTTEMKPWKRLSFGSRRAHTQAFLHALNKSRWFSRPRFAAFLVRLYARALADLPSRAALRLRC